MPALGDRFGRLRARNSCGPVRVPAWATPKLVNRTFRAEAAALPGKAAWCAPCTFRIKAKTSVKLSATVQN